MKKILFLVALSLLFIQCDDSKKKAIPFFGAPSQTGSTTSGTTITDNSGKVIVTDGTVTEGSTIPIPGQDSGTTTTTGNTENQSSGNTTQTTTDNQTTGGDTGSSENVVTEGNTTAGGTTGGPTTTTNEGGSADTGQTGGTTEQPPQIPDVTPVDDLGKPDSQFAKYDIKDSAGIYWIKDLYQDGKSIFGWEFPPSFVIKVQSIEPRAKVLVTMYGVYPGKETSVFYQYMVVQGGFVCADDAKDNKKNSDNKCPMKDVGVDESKWIVVGGKDFKYAYIEFQVIDENGTDISSTTKAKINVHLGDSALTAYLMKIKHHPSPAIIMATLLLCGIIVGINLLRRRRLARI